MSSEFPIFNSNNKVIDAVAMTANISGTVVDIAETPLYCVHAIWTGSPVGNVVVSASNDNINFVAIDTAAAGGSANQHLLNVEKAGYRYVKVTYVFTSGTGSLTVYVSTKKV